MPFEEKNILQRLGLLAERFHPILEIRALLKLKACLVPEPPLSFGLYIGCHALGVTLDFLGCLSPHQNVLNWESIFL